MLQRAQEREARRVGGNKRAGPRVKSRGVYDEKGHRCCSCRAVCVCVARVKSESFVLHKSADSGGDVRTNRAALCCSWPERGRNGREGYREREREQDSSC